MAADVAGRGPPCLGPRACPAGRPAPQVRGRAVEVEGAAGVFLALVADCVRSV